VPPPWRKANAITSDAPLRMRSRTRVSALVGMATATSAVGWENPHHHTPCEASTRLHRERHQQRKQNAHHSMAIMSWNQSLRAAAAVAHQQQDERAQPAIAVRTREGQRSNPETAGAVAGSVPPKIAMPIKPATDRECSRENGAEA